MAGHHGMIDPFVIIAVDVLDRAKGTLVNLLFGPLVNNRTLGTRKRQRIGIAFDEVLTQLRPNKFQQKPQIADDRIIALSQNEISRTKD